MASNSCAMRAPLLVAHTSRKAHQHGQQPTCILAVTRAPVALQVAARPPQAHVRWHPVLRRPALVPLMLEREAHHPRSRASPPCASIHKACARASQSAHTPRAAPNSSAATSCMPDLL